MVKAAEMTLKDLINLRNEEGGNFLKDHRMIISSADALGVLGRDLIVALGFERAKRFLLRYGWHFGVHEADVFKDLFDWDNDMEWLLAGQIMHNISGRVLSIPTKLDIDLDAGRFVAEGHWYNSYEANSYLRHFPPHLEPVCYFLVGYGGGYTSRVMGKKIIFKEVECVGKGDPHCRYIAKTLEEWGDEIAEDLVNYDQEDLTDELDRAYKRIEKQNSIQKHVALINQKLTKIILQGKGFDSIARTLADSLRCGVAIQNHSGDIISAYGNVPQLSYHTWVEELDPGDPIRQKLRRMFKERCTIQLDVGDQWGPPHIRLITPIVLHDQIYGYISFIKMGETFGELEPVLLERSANICAILMLNEQTKIETEQRLKGELLDELLNQPADSPPDLRRYAYLGYDLNQPHYVFVFQLRENHAGRAMDHDALRSDTVKIKNMLMREIESAGHQALVSTRLDRVHALIPATFLQNNRGSVKEFGETFVAKVKPALKSADIVLGISNLCQNMQQFSAGFKEANKAIEICKIKKNASSVVMAADLGFLGLLLDARKPEELLSFADSLIGPLLEYDANKGSELLKTVYTYLENECNLYKTARILNVSISGMRYRINRIRELTGLDLTVSSTRYDIHLAVDIYLALGKLQF